VHVLSSSVEWGMGEWEKDRHFFAPDMRVG